VGVGVRVVAAVVVTAVVLLGLVWAFQRRLVFLPSGAPPGVPVGVTPTTLRTDDGLDLAAWFVPAPVPGPAPPGTAPVPGPVPPGTAPAPGPAPPGATVLVFPGNAGSRADRVALARALNARGLDVLLVDYRGYGGNPGSPTEEGLAADARAAHRHLVAGPQEGGRGLDPARLVVFGESLGAAVAARLARERPVGALVLRSPFTALADVGALHYPFLPVRLLLRDRFPVREHAAGIAVPVAVVAGGADEIVPRDQSRAVAAAARATYVEVPGALHNDPGLSHGPAVVDTVVRVTA
jgi:hypothetical protein